MNKTTIISVATFLAGVAAGVAVVALTGKPKVGKIKQIA